MPQGPPRQDGKVGAASDEPLSGRSPEKGDEGDRPCPTSALHEGVLAGAHDLRRVFSSRWARKAMPAILQRLARHAHISTTMCFYVFLTADQMVGDLWANHGTLANNRREGNISGNIDPEQGNDEGQAIGHKSLCDRK
jgi:hypothetical protein